MLITALNGSPNKNGNTKFLLEKVMNTVSDLGATTKIFDVSELLSKAKHPFCTACSNPCSGICYTGTKLEESFELLKDSDAIVVGSPSYFGTVSGQLKAYFDKTRKLRSQKGLYNKIGVCVCSGASRFGGQETTIKAIHDIMLVHGMNIIGDGYIENDCGHHGVCAQRPCENDQIAIDRAIIVGKRLFEVCKK